MSDVYAIAEMEFVLLLLSRKSDMGHIWAEKSDLMSLVLQTSL